MDNVSWSVLVLMLTGVVWLTGAVLHWHNIRRQEQMIARLRRLSARRRPAASVEVLEDEPEEAEPDALAESLRPSKHWTVG
jgi:hypothetical protein